MAVLRPVMESEKRKSMGMEEKVEQSIHHQFRHGECTLDVFQKGRFEEDVLGGEHVLQRFVADEDACTFWLCSSGWRGRKRSGRRS